MAIGLVGTVIGALGAGQIGQRLGSRETLRITAILYVVSAPAAACAWNWSSFLVFRLDWRTGHRRLLGARPGVHCRAGAGQMAWAPGRHLSVQRGVRHHAGLRLELHHPHLAPGRDGVALAGGHCGGPCRPFLVALVRHSPQPALVRFEGSDRRSVGRVQDDGRSDPEAELADIRAALQQEHATAHERVFQWKYRYPLFLAISIGAFNQLAGINAILYYINDIFGAAGFSQISGDQQAIAIGATKLVFS